jgi:hypothetical protein
VDIWVAALNGGEPPTQVAYGFAASAEREGQHVTADYNAFLGRPPSQAEVSAWVDAFVHQGVSNEGVIAGFVGSAEYFKAHFGNVTDWLGDAYASLFSLSATQAVATPSWLAGAATVLTHSAEYYAGVVALAYQRYLGRPPSPSETAGWVSAMQQGLSDEHLEAGFIGSQEYINAHGGQGAGWVTGMYKDLLGRSPSQQEVDLWVGVLAGGTSTEQVAYGFAASAEREGQHVTADYNAFLGRPPSQAEVAAWVDGFVHQGVTNEGVIAGFAGSPEYFQKQNSKVADWLYQAVLGIFGPSGF